MKEISKKEIKDLINKEDPTIIEIGCYDGKDSRELYDLFKNPLFFCFEPDPRSQELFDKFDKRQGLHLIKRAVGNKDDNNVDFYLSDSDTRRHYKHQKSWSASSSLKKPKHHLELFKDVEFKKNIKVKCIKLDTWYENTGFGIFANRNQIIDFIWVDINGAEEDFILGAINTLQKFTRYLYIEFSDKELYEGQITKDQILKYLTNFELVEIYNFQGNFGNLLLKNKKYE